MNRHALSALCVLLLLAWGVSGCHQGEPRSGDESERGPARTSPTPSPSSSAKASPENTPEAPPAPPPAAEKTRSPAAAALVKRFEKHATTTPGDEGPASAPTKQEFEKVARAFFQALVNDDRKAGDELLLSDQDIETYYRGSVARILATSRKGSIDQEWAHYQKLTAGEKPTILRVEAAEPELEDPAKNPAPFTGKVYVIPTARLILKLGETNLAVRFKSILYTKRGWRALQFEVE